MQLFRRLLLALLLLVLTTEVSAQYNREYFFWVGRRCMMNNDYQEAIRTLNTLLRFDEEAFEGIAADRVIIPDGCQRIEARAFVNCPNLREIHIPDSVWSIGDDAFDVRDDLVIITDNGVIQEWADNHHILWFNE